MHYFEDFYLLKIIIHHLYINKIMNGDYLIAAFISSNIKDLIISILNIDLEKRFSIVQIKSHILYKITMPVYFHEGLIIGYNRVPIQDEILKIMESQGFDPKYIERCLDANKYNHATTTYIYT